MAAITASNGQLAHADKRWQRRCDDRGRSGGRLRLPKPLVLKVPAKTSERAGATCGLTHLAKRYGITAMADVTKDGTASWPCVAGRGPSKRAASNARLLHGRRGHHGQGVPGDAARDRRPEAWVGLRPDQGALHARRRFDEPHRRADRHGPARGFQGAFFFFTQWNRPTAVPREVHPGHLLSLRPSWPGRLFGRPQERRQQGLSPGQPITAPTSPRPSCVTWRAWGTHNPDVSRGSMSAAFRRHAALKTS